MTLQEALSCALEYEHKVRDHYAESARKTQDVQGQKIFASLAREEQGHVEYLETRLAEWEATGAITPGELPSALPPPAWIHDAAAKVAASTLPPSGGAGNGVLPELDYLRQALVLERMTCAFYQDMVATLEPPQRELFNRFLAIEDGHLALVQAEIDALTGHGRWFEFTDYNE